MTRSADALLDLFDLEEIDVDIFRGRTPDGGPGRLFGGQVAAQSLRAAAATVPEHHRVHSLHAYFLLPGRPGHPIVFNVNRVRDGRSFTTRQVAAVQRGETIFGLAASFHAEEQGPVYESPAPAGVPSPDDLGPDSDAATRWHFGSRWPIARLEFDPEPVPGGPTRRMWVRIDAELPDDPVLHRCLIAFLSDMGMVSASRKAIDHGGRDRFMGASLDHALWFHSDARADEWLLCEMRPTSVRGARGLAFGTIHSRAGRLVASVAQEALLRPWRDR